MSRYYQLFKLNKYASNYTAEAEAILKALEYAHTLDTSKVCIMSDCRSVLQELVSKKSTLKVHPTVLKIINSYIKLKRKRVEVKFYWVKAHVGIAPNEVVDALAKQAIAEASIVLNTMCLGDINAVVRREITQLEWDKYWKESYQKKMTQYALIHPSIFIKPWYKEGNISKSFYSTIARLKFGHGQFPVHLHRIGLKDSPSCSCGEEYGDLNHILFQCVKQTSQREIFMEELIKRGIMMPTNVVLLLQSNMKTIYEVIIKFLRSSKVKI